MASILDHIAEHKSNKAYAKDKHAAWDYFVMQKSAIEAIASTAWYREIIGYWHREIAAATKRLSTMKSEDIKIIQAEMQQAQRFVDFLESILSADIDLSSN